VIREGEKPAHIVLDRSDELFAPDLAPGGVKPEDWAIARQEALRQAHSVLATLAANRKDYTQAEAEFGKLLEMAPDDAAATHRLGSPLLIRNKPLAILQQSFIWRVLLACSRTQIRLLHGSIRTRSIAPAMAT
jgi:hypothetical protein